MYKVNIKWNLCRICFSEDDENLSCKEWKNIFDEDKDSLQISAKIIECAGIDLRLSENLPSSICTKCLAYLNISYKFRKLCHDSEEKLKHFLKNANIQQEDTNLEQTDRNNYNIIEEIYVDGEFKNDTDVIMHDIPTDTQLDEIKSSENDVSNSEKEHDDSLQLKKEQLEDDLQTLPLNSDNSKKYVITLFPDDLHSKHRKTHICDICGNQYNKKSGLENHIKWHNQEKNCICEICNKGFVTDFQLSRHMRTHTGEKPYSCQHCARRFADISTKTKHERIHTNERPYKCDVCEKAFNYSDVLRNHKLIHSGEKPFACEICNKRFTQYHHLKAHLQTLTHQTNSSNL